MRHKKLFVVSAAGYLLSSASVLPMGAGDISGKNGSATLAVISAIIFWLSLMTAVAAQLFLQRKEKPYKRRMPFKEMVLSPPTVFFEVGFLLALLAVIVLTVLNINGFVLLLILFLMLSCLELAILTMGKFQKEDGKTVLKI